MNRLAVACYCLLALITISSQPLSHADTISAIDRAFFENKIRPVLVEHCYECHSAESSEVGGKLLVDRREGILEGGESGPAVVAGRPEESLIIQALRYQDDLQMPPEDPLPESVISDFVEWVSRGAADPRPDEPVQPALEALDPDALWSFPASASSAGTGSRRSRLASRSDRPLCLGPNRSSSVETDE